MDGRLKSSKVVTVSGITEDITENEIKVIFRNEINTGGGEIEEYAVFRETRNATIVYREEKVAKRVLGRKTITHNGTALHVKPWPRQHPFGDTCTVLVVVSSGTQNVDTVRLLCANKDISNGGPVKDVRQLNNTQFTVQFQRLQDAQNVLQKETLEFSGTTYIVKVFTPPPPGEWDGCTVLITDIPDFMTWDIFKLLYTDNSASGAGKGKIIESSFREGQATATILYEKREDANSVIRKGVCEHEGHEMKASVPTAKVIDSTPNDRDVRRTGSSIRINGKSLQKDKVETLFGDHSKSGGGPIRRIVINEDRDVAVVHFEDDSGAQSVLDKHRVKALSFGIFSANLDVALCDSGAITMDPPTGHGSDVAPLDRDLSCAVEVTNLPDDTKVETLQQFFEVQSLSGGGPLEGCVYLQEQQRAVLHYERQEDAANVMCQYNRDGIRFSAGSGSDLRLKLIKSNSRLLERHRANTKSVYVKNIPEDQNSEEVTKYFDYRLPYSRVKTVTFGTNVGVALVSFDKFPGRVQLHNLVCQRPLHTNMLEIAAVEMLQTVEVYGYGDQSRGSLQSYFAHTKSGGGDIDGIEEEHYIDEKIALVTFKQEGAAQNVLRQKSHKSNGVTLKVVQHYRDIGFLPPGHQTLVQNQKPSDVQYSFTEPSILAFVLAHEKEKLTLETQLKPLDVLVIWPLDPGHPVTCRYNSKETKNTRESRVWQENVTRTLSSFCQRYRYQHVPIMKSGWQALKSECQGMDWTGLDYWLVDDQCFVAFSGYKTKVDEQMAEVSKAKVTIERSLQRRRDMTIESKTCRPHELRLMNMHALKAKVEQSYGDMTLEFDWENGKVNTTGVGSEVNEVQKMLSDFIKGISDVVVHLSELKSVLVKKKTVVTYMKEELDREHLLVVWEVEERNLNVYSRSKDHLDIGAQTIKACLFETSVDFGKVNTDLLGTPRWNSFRESFSTQYDGYAILQPADRKLHIAGLVKVMKDAVKLVTRFVNDNSIAFLSIQVGKYEAEYIKKYLTPALDEEVENLRQEGHILTVRPSVKESEPGYTVETTTNAAPAVKKRLQEFCSKVLHLAHCITKRGAVSYFISAPGKMCLLGIEGKHKVIIVSGPQFEASPSSCILYSDATFSRFPGKKLLFEIRDITQMNVDAIVNAADPKLDHGGGIAKAIVDKGGQEIQTECSDYIKTHGHMKPGEVYVTQAGNLPCEKVIHTVGPKWKGGKGNEETELHMAITAPLYEANSLEMTSLAMPAISTGKYGFPMDEACGIIVQALLAFMNEETKPTEIHLVDTNEAVIIACQKVLSQVAGENVSVTNLKGFVDVKPRYPNDPIPGDERGDPSSSGVEKETSAEDGYWKRTRENNVIQTKEGLKVVIMHGSITDHRADGIVNLTSRDLNLSSGIVSKAILGEAGHGIQDECKKSHPTGLRYGQVAATSGGKNSYWKRIYHGACQHHCPTAERDMEKFVLGCFWMAESDSLKSIAFPSIGTGSLGFPARTSARIILNKVKDFSKKNPATSLKTVYIVIFDDPIFKAFETFMEEVLQPGFVSVQKEPALTKHPPRTEVTTKEGVTVKVVGGDIFNEKADVIVNLTSKNFDLSLGYLSKQLHAKAGNSVQKELNQKTSGGVQNCDVVETTAGNLGCKRIYHGTCATYNEIGSTKEIEAFVGNCLTRASVNQMTSIAIPALGTGALGYSADSIITAFFSEVNRFSAGNAGTSLRKVTFVNNDGKIKRAFERRLWELEETVGDAKPATDKEVVKRDRILTAAWQATTARGHRRTVEVKRDKAPRDLLLQVYGLTKVKVKEAIIEIDDMASKQVMVKEFSETKHQENIRQLTPALIAQIKKLEDSHDVEIKVEQGANSRILVEGSPSDTADAIQNIMEIFNEIQKDLREEKSKELITRQVQWQFLDNRSYENYPKDINLIIETAHLEEKDTVTWHEKAKSGCRDVIYKIDLKSKEETNSVTNERRKVKRNVEGADAGFELPLTWDEMGTDDVLVMTLNKGDKEYSDVQDTFFSSMAKLKVTYQSIVEIRRVQNVTLYQSYMAKRKNMEQKVENGANTVKPFERVLWHATGKEILDEINRSGFNRSFSGGKHGAWYGKGCYFATHAGLSARSYSDKGTPEKFMYMCKVLTGDYKQVGKDCGILVAPCKDEQNPTIRFDSVVDNQTNPNEWIIFTDAQAYPEYIIVFQL